jgi:ubiquinone/menaquinone biosynthesis C-methylase UbiE
VKKLVRSLTPPLLWTALAAGKRRLARSPAAVPDPHAQSLEDYWDPKMAAILETWGENNVWIEIQLLLAARSGKVLDIACGTGKTMQILDRYPQLELHGFDISDLLIEKAVERGIARERLKVLDATRTDYRDGEFAFGYSIGSLEHFTEEGILDFLRECKRVVGGVAFHQIPVSADGRDHGWIRTFQSYHNNSVDWWMQRFRQLYPQVEAIDSVWKDAISKGKWFVCGAA